MSEIRATTISDAAGTGPITLTGQSAAKAWVNFDGTGTIAARDSVNVASLVDNNTGDYTVNFSNAFSAADYAKSGIASSDGAAITILSEKATANTLTTSCTVIARVTNTAGARDPEINNLIFHGDLA